MAGKLLELFRGNRKNPLNSQARKLLRFGRTNTEAVGSGFYSDKLYCVDSSGPEGTEVSPFDLSMLRSLEEYLQLGDFKGQIEGLNAVDRAALFPNLSFTYYQNDDTTRRLRGGWIKVPTQEATKTPTRIVFVATYNYTTKDYPVEQQVKFTLDPTTQVVEKVSLSSWIATHENRTYHLLGETSMALDTKIPYDLEAQEELSQDVDPKTDHRYVIADLHLHLPTKLPAIVESSKYDSTSHKTPPSSISGKNNKNPQL